LTRERTTCLTPSGASMHRYTAAAVGTALFDAAAQNACGNH
jgi:hypothetical protein